MTSILKTDEIQSQNGGAVVKMQKLKHPSASGNNLELASDGSTTIANGTLSAGTIADAVTQPATDYIQGRVQAAHAVGSYTMLNLSGSSNPYVSWTGSIASFGNGEGSTVTGTSTNDLLIRTKGVYFIGFSATFFGSSNASTRQVYSLIRCAGGTSQGTTELAYSMEQVSNAGSSATDYGNAANTYIGLFNANDQINFQVYALGGLGIHDSSHITVFKLKSLA